MNKQQSSFLIRSSSSVECTFIFSHPTFSTCPGFKFSLPTTDFGHCTCKFPHSTFNFLEFNFNPLVSDRWRSWAQLTWPTPAQMVVESRSRDFPVEWTKETFSTPDNPDVDTRRQQIEHGRSPPRRCTVFEGGECCPTDGLIWKGVFHEKSLKYLT